MRETLKFLIGALIFCLGFPGQCLDLTRINLDYHYDVNALIRFDYRVVDQDSTLVLFCKIKTQVEKKYDLQLLVQRSYSQEDHDSLSSYTLDTIKASPKEYLIQITVPQSVKNNLLIVAFYDPTGGSSLFFDVPFFSPIGYPKFYPVDKSGLPIVEKYVVDEMVVFEGLSGDSCHVYEYADQFIGADPPMGPMKAIAPMLSVDSSFTVSHGIDSLSLQHFYLVQTDSLAQNGVTLLKAPFYFPATKRLEDLIGPLQYITTSEENRSLYRDANPKAAFERFWINTYGTKFRAKGAIRTYYSMVQESNQLFTDYKTGWKTDRGMIYIVYGKPDVVTREKGTETWKYSNGMEFEFIRISTLFAPLIYSLKRDIKYEDAWYDRVGEIRNG